MVNTFRQHAIIFILVFGCLMMSLLVVQQDRTIHSQRLLINQLFHDSLELNALKVQQINTKAHR